LLPPETKTDSETALNCSAAILFGDKRRVVLAAAGWYNYVCEHIPTQLNGTKNILSFARQKVNGSNVLPVLHDVAV